MKRGTAERRGGDAHDPADVKTLLSRFSRQGIQGLREAHIAEILRLPSAHVRLKVAREAAEQKLSPGRTRQLVQAMLALTGEKKSDASQRPEASSLGALWRDMAADGRDPPLRGA
jgi:hypothetical protein